MKLISLELPRLWYNISKYLEDLEERKKINQKLDNILEMIKMEYNTKQDDTKTKLNINSEFRENNLMNILSSPQFLLNLSKINDLSKINEPIITNSANTINSTNLTTSYE